MQALGVIGAGAWGTALALALERAGRDVLLWGRNPDRLRELGERRENARYLPGVHLPPGIRIESGMAELCRGSDALLLAVPAQHLREIAAGFAPVLPPGVPLVISAKGIERTTLALMHEVIEAVLPRHPVAILSGPSFAGEVASELPTAVTLASRDQGLATELAQAIGSRSFRPYLSDDPVGVEIGGAIKNVIAIACGIVIGRALGENARAALITRGLAETVRLAVAMGGRSETLSGLAGLGDLALTCAGAGSRNYSFGVALGKGRTKEAVLAERHAVTEGVFTAEAAVKLAARHGVEMPIANAVDAVLNRGAGIDRTIEALLARPLKPERT